MLNTWEKFKCINNNHKDGFSHNIHISSLQYDTHQSWNKTIDFENNTLFQFDPTFSWGPHTKQTKSHKTYTYEQNVAMDVDITNEEGIPPYLTIKKQSQIGEDKDFYQSSYSKKIWSFSDHTKNNNKSLNSPNFWNIHVPCSPIETQNYEKSMDGEEHPGKDNIASPKIKKLNKWNPISPTHTNKQYYRSHLNKKFKNKCAISGVDMSECEGAHIIPKSICQKFDLKFIFHRANGILLSRNLHASFDNFIWTFDIWDFKESSIPGWILLSTIVIQDTKNYTIKDHQQGPNGLNYFPVPIESLPYLYTHYNMFIVKNYNIPQNNDLQLYKNLLEDSFFQMTLFSPEKFLNEAINISKNGKRTYRAIIDKRHNSFSQIQYLVLWNYLPFSQISWEDENTLTNREPIREFEYRKSIKLDPNY